jgi:hypothetical protein
MKALLLSLLLLGAAPEGNAPALPPEALAAPPLADDSPTAWACTIDTLRAGKECVFEAEASSSDAPNADLDSANQKLLREVGKALCTEAVGTVREGRPDAALTALCEKRYSAAVDQCGLDGTALVVDAKGRFAPGARACYRALSNVLQEVQLMATVASSCCECGARSGCAGTGERCYVDVSQQTAAPATLACLGQRCADACSLALPDVPASRPAPTAREQGKSSRSGSASL